MGRVSRSSKPRRALKISASAKKKANHDDWDDDDDFDDDFDDEPAPTRRRRGRRSLGPSLRRGVYWVLVLGLWSGIAAIAMIVWVGAHLPPIHSLEIPKRPPSIQILGYNLAPLTTRGDAYGDMAPLKELPKHLPQAVIAIEDRRFYEHHGIDPMGIGRAALANVTRRSVAQGGSTLTQQLAKNLFLTQERTITRKLQEAMLALWLEHKFTKREILELYLNRVYFGAGAFGIEAAAQRYFGKTARRLTLPESALLAGLLKSPSRLAPTRNPSGAERRAQVVLAAMSESGFITEDSAKVAMLRPARALKPSGGGSVNYVGDWVMDVVNDLIGHIDEDIVVETTIDPALQAIAEKALVDELTLRGPKFDVEQGALLAMSPNGAVRSLIGGKNYAESQFNRAIAAKRQPGSTFKPFLYLAALERGLTPDTIRDDRPIDIKGWRPENYKGEYFGPVPLRKALSHSLNTVAVRLAIEIGPKDIASTANRLGVTSKLESNLTLALGTSEVSLLEMVSAFASFANGGMAATPHIVRKIRTAGGKTLYQRADPQQERVIEERHVAAMNSMLRETLTQGTARRADLPGWDAAGKTGTSQDFRDGWFIGYTAHLVTGVWLGNDDSSATRKTTGGGMPVDIWSKVMKAAHVGAPIAALPGGRGGWASAFGSPRFETAHRFTESPLLERIFGRRGE